MSLQSRRANRFDRLLTASLVAIIVLVCLKLLCSTVIDFAGAVRVNGRPVAVVKYVVQPYALLLTDDDTLC